MTMITIYGDVVSGNCLKVKYVADYIGLKYSWKHIDVVGGGAKAEEFLKINPVGQVPTVVFEDGSSLSQSNAIMRHLAKGTNLIPSDDWGMAKMDEWLFWEQYSHETAIAVARFQVVYKKKPISDLDPALVDKGNAALDIMEKHLSQNDWFVGDRVSLADVALFAYTQFANVAGFDLEKRVAIITWLKSVRNQFNIDQ